MTYILVILIALFQMTVLNVFRVANIKPDLLLIFVVFVGLYKGPLKAATVGVLAGFMKDIFSIGTFSNALIFPICGIAVSLLAEKFYLLKDRLAVQFLTVLAVSLIVSFLNLIEFANWDYPPPLFLLAARVGIPTVLYTALITPALFFIFKETYKS